MIRALSFITILHVKVFSIIFTWSAFSNSDEYGKSKKYCRDHKNNPDDVWTATFSIRYILFSVFSFVMIVVMALTIGVSFIRRLVGLGLIRLWIWLWIRIIWLWRRTWINGLRCRVVWLWLRGWIIRYRLFIRIFRVFDRIYNWFWLWDRNISFWARFLFLFFFCFFLILSLNPPLNVYFVTWQSKSTCCKSKSALIDIKYGIESFEKCITDFYHFRSSIFVICYQQSTVFSTLYCNIIHQIPHWHREKVVFDL